MADVRKSSGDANSNSANAKVQPAASKPESLENGREKHSDAQKDKGADKKTDDIQMRDPSPPRKQDEPKRKAVQSVPPSPTTKPVSESPAQTPMSPKYAPPLSAVSTKFPSELKSLALEVARSKPVPMKIKGAKGREALYRNIIKSAMSYLSLDMLTYLALYRHEKNAANAYIDYREAQTGLKRWKDTQNSTIYGHATQETRKILDSERATIHRRLQDVEDTFQKAINALVNLPEPLNSTRTPNVLTKELIAQYTQELQDWIKDLELHKRLLMEKKKEETEEGEIADEEKEDGEVNDSEEEMTGQRPSELLRTGQWAWKELTEVMKALVARFDSIQTTVYFDIFTCLDDDSRARLRQASASLQSTDREETQDNKLTAVSETIATAGKTLERQSEALAKSLIEVAELEKNVEAVRIQTTEAGLICQLV
jgi:hypothetical protein